MKILHTRIINTIMNPKKVLKDLVLSSTVNTEKDLLSILKSDKTVDTVKRSSEVDLFLVSLDLTQVFKIAAEFLYVVQESESFNFIMMPKYNKSEVSDLINFLASSGVSSVIEVHNVVGKKRYTADDIKNNIDDVVKFSGYIKHYKHENNSYTLPVINEYAFNSKVIAKDGFYILELPSSELNLSEHLDYYTEINGNAITPVSKDANGYYEYSENDFKFITRLVLAHNFNPKRITEVFKIPVEAFTGYLVERYRYKLGNIATYDYTDDKHDVALLMTYSNSNFSYNPYKIFVA